MKKPAFFSWIETFHGDAPFGRLLDAGTGPSSIGWLLGVETDSITAVTGEPRMKADVDRLMGESKRPQDRLLLGNWKDPELLAGEMFDTVLSDHLLGAIEGFAPYFQTALFRRLRAMTGKRLYVTGMHPYVVVEPADEAGSLIWQIGRYRDACLLLLGRQPYREFPLDWVLDELGRSGFRPVAQQRIPVGYREPFVNGQINLVRPGLQRMADRDLAEALIARGEAIRERALAHIEAHGTLRHGFSYVVAAEPV